MIFVLDNYDSFTFNLVQYLGELGAELDVVRNDRVTLDEVAARRPAGVVISPGPGTPQRAGLSIPLVRWAAAERTPLLGVCLGHQAIAAAFGARIVRADRIMHGKTSEISHDGVGVLEGLPSPFAATRYHSLVVERDSIPPQLQVTAVTADGVVMALRHRELPIEGVQFHPESILTTEGMRILESFLRSTRVPSTPQILGRRYEGVSDRAGDGRGTANR